MRRFFLSESNLFLALQLTHSRTLQLFNSTQTLQKSPVALPSFRNTYRAAAPAIAPPAAAAAAGLDVPKSSSRQRKSSMVPTRRTLSAAAASSAAASANIAAAPTDPRNVSSHSLLCVWVFFEAGVDGRFLGGEQRGWWKVIFSPHWRQVNEASLPLLHLPFHSTPSPPLARHRLSTS